MATVNAGFSLSFHSIDNLLKEMDKRLIEYLSNDHEIISKVMEPYIRKSGKRLRPALVLLCAGASGASSREGIRYALAVELIHCASLFHDDVIDDATLRRGIPSANRVLGNHLSILLGDYLYSKALALLIPDGKVIQRYVNTTVTKMTEGEILQAVYRWNDSGGEAMYFWIIERKTAELMSLACRLGASVNENGGLSDRFAQYGWNIGMAFQMIDDLLDWTSNERKLKKDCFKDIHEGRITLPAILLRDRLPESERAAFVDCITSGPETLSFKMLKKYQKAMYDYDVVTSVKERARKYSKTAVRILDGLPPTPFLEELVSLTDILLEREH